MTGFFQKLFGSQRSSADPPQDQGPLDVQEPAPVGVGERSPAPFQASPETPQLVVGAAQSVGMQRDHNEDSLLTLTVNLESGKTQLPFGLYIVADGMGGHQFGEVASEVAVRALASHTLRKLYTPLLAVRPLPPEDSIQEILRAGVGEAHQTVSNTVAGGGTTLTAVLVLGEQLTIAHVGDSRAYSISPQDEIKALTRDHSLVNRMVELGQISPEEAAVHPQRNVLYRALGLGEPIDADISTSPLPHGGYILLCSDGLWGVVSEEELLRLVKGASTPQQACREMVDAANAAGGPDNITAILVQIPG